MKKYIVLFAGLIIWFVSLIMINNNYLIYYRFNFNFLIETGITFYEIFYYCFMFVLILLMQILSFYFFFLFVVLKLKLKPVKKKEISEYKSGEYF